jgi:UDP-glucose 4-epimerase
VLITGGAGFVGSHLAEALLERGDEVYVLDNLSTGSIDNIQHLKTHPRFHYTIDTVTNEPLLAELIDRATSVVHLAAAVGVKLIVEAPVTRSRPTCTAPRSCSSTPTRRRSWSSSLDVRGVRQEHGVPFARTPTWCWAPPKHRWAYACSKAIDEFLALGLLEGAQAAGDHRAAVQHRRAAADGPYGMVIPTFVRQALAGEPITVYGDGTQTRSFTYVGDVVRAMVAWLDEPGAVGQVFNIGNTEEITIGASRPREGPDRQRLRDRARPLRSGVRGRVRGHAAPRARHLEDPGAHRLRTDRRAGRDPDRVIDYFRQQ